MFKYYMSKDYRQIYNDLDKLGLLNDTINLQYQKYQEYFNHTKTHHHDIEQHLEILGNQKITSVRAVKMLLFLHAWVQATASVWNAEIVLNFIGNILKGARETADKLKKNVIMHSKKISKSAVLNSDWMQNSQHIQFSKEVFLLQDIVRPYVLYIQKMVTIFDFYNALKRNYTKPISTSDVWILLNLFKCVTAITNHIPSICKFIRKSYKSIAESLGIAFSKDINNFYPKIYKYCYCQSNRIQNQFQALESQHGEKYAIKKIIEGVEMMANLVLDVRQLNMQLKGIYDQQTMKDNKYISQPKMIEIYGNQFDFILHLDKLRKQPELLITNTPKFYISHSSKGTHKTQEESIHGFDGLPPIFRDITNQQDTIVTFRKQEYKPVPFLQQKRKLPKKRYDTIHEFQQ